jgi:NAD(P)-dependent dehydrogenase (short-subunit alcohol dehydrogenase family)
MNLYKAAGEDQSLSLQNQKILVTGASRSFGIGAAITKRCAMTGASIAIHGYPNYDMKLMLQAFAKQVKEDTGGVITLFTSGQYLGPMTEEIAYAVSKEAVRGLCEQAAAALAPKNIRATRLPANARQYFACQLLHKTPAE